VIVCITEMENVYCAVRTEYINSFKVLNSPLLPSVLMTVVVVVIIIR